jgi:hypothetical protein
MANENTKIFSEAIAEAKAIRETAMANAKLALEEAFTPRLKEMMSTKLEALAEEDEELEERFTGKNGEMTSNDGDDTGSMEEISLEELLAELEGLEEGEKEVYEEETIEENTEIFEEAEDDDTVAEITVDDLKDIIRDVVADLLGGSEGEEEEAGEEEEIDGEEELSLEEILAELDSLNENEAMEKLSEKELSDSAAAGAAELERMIKSLATKLGISFEAAYDKIGDMIHSGKGVGVRESEAMEEAMSTISTLRSELNEVNLLNAKLLYVNKLFKSKNLTEAQKVKVINAFDRAETVKETKNIFETLQESLTAAQATKNPIKESLSFASKPAGVADRKPIVENNDFVARMQKLAGII